tara:strand:+ start:112 stop:492 length:381 start_codon:yes stop_codon:yes gene_type:complete
MPTVEYTQAKGLFQATGSGLLLHKEIGTAVTAAGSSNADAAAITLDGQVIPLTAGDGTKGVILPAGTVGQSVVLVNTASGICKLYPAATEKINNLTVTSGSHSIPANQSVMVVYVSSGYGWAVIGD